MFRVLYMIFRTAEVMSFAINLRDSLSSVVILGSDVELSKNLTTCSKSANKLSKSCLHGLFQDVNKFGTSC